MKNNATIKSISAIIALSCISGCASIMGNRDWPEKYQGANQLGTELEKPFSDFLSDCSFTKLDEKSTSIPPKLDKLPLELLT